MKYSSYLRHRGGSKSSDKSTSSDGCNDSKYDLKYRKREIREALSYWDYKEFYKIFRTLAKNFKYETGLDYNCDYNWEDLINEALCQVDNTFDVCQPARQSEWETFLADMAANDIYSLYGPDFVNQIDTYCEDTKIMNPDYDSECVELVCEPEYLFTEQCEYFRSLYPEGDEVYPEIGLRYLDQIIQNTFNGSFCEWSSTFGSDGWYTECTEYDLSGITTPIEAWFLYEDVPSDEMTNRPIILPYARKTVTWNDMLMGEIFAGSNQNSYLNELRSALN